MQLRTVKPCGSGTRCWCQVGEGFASPTGFGKAVNSSMTVTKGIRRRGERGVSRKAIAQGMSDASAEPVCSCAFFSTHFAHETAGAARIRHSPRPLISGCESFLANLGRIAPRDLFARLELEDRHC